MGLESFLASIDQMNQEDRHLREIHGERIDYAGAVAALKATITALREFDPNHALLTPEALKAAHNAGEKAYRKIQNWDVARQAGADYYKSINYSVKASPQIAKLEQENAALKARLAELEAVNVQNYAEKVLYRRAVRVTDKDHPALVDPFVVSGVRKAALQSFTFTKSYDEVNKVVEDYRYPETSRADRLSLESYRGERTALQRRIDSLDDPKHLEILRRLREREDSQPK